MPFTSFVLLQIFTAFILIGLSGYGWEHRDIPVARPFALVMLLCATWSLEYALNISNPLLESKIILSKVQVTLLAVLPVALLAMALAFVGRARQVYRWRNLAIFMIPLITTILVWTEDSHTLFRYNFRLNVANQFSEPLFDQGVWYRVHLLSSYALFLIALVILVRALREASPLRKRQTWLLMAGIFVPLLTDMAFRLGLTPIAGYDFASSTLFFTGLLDGWALFRYRLFDVAPIARSTVVENMSDLVLVVDERDRLVDFNPAARRVLDLPPQSIGQPIDHALSRWPTLIERSRTTPTAHAELSLGEVEQRRFYDLLITPIKDQTDQLVGRLILLRDITDRKQAEKELADTRAMLEAAFAQTPIPMALVSLPDQILRITNSACREFLGIQAEPSYVGRPLLQMHQTWQEIDSEGRPVDVGDLPLAQALQGITTRDKEYIIVRKDGTQRWEMVSGAPIYNSAGEQIAAYVVFPDITERKLAEQALLQSEKLYRLLAENMSDVVWILDAESMRFRYVSPSVEHLRGYTVEEVMAQSAVESLTPISQQYLNQVMPGRVTDYLTNGAQAKPYSDEIEQPCRDGSTVWTEVVTRYYTNVETGKLEIHGVSRDITERKRVEQALREKTAELDRFFSLGLDLLCIADTDGYFRRLNVAWEKALGYPLAELEGKKFLDLVHPDDLESTLAAITDLSAEKPVLNFTNRYRCRDGSYRWLEWRSYPYQGKWIYAAARDITEHRQLEESLREQRLLAESLRDISGMINSTLNLDEVLDRILDNVGRVVAHDAASIMLVDEVGLIHVPRGRGFDRDDLHTMLTTRLKFNEVDTLRTMAETDRPLLIPDTQTSDLWNKTLPASEQIRSYVGAPVSIRGKVIGFINLDSRTPGFYTPAQAERLQTFADQAAVAIENAKLYDTVQYYAAELEQRVAERTRELTEANERLTELDRLKDQFVSRISHELRTPLANIHLYLELLEHGKPGKQDQYMQTLRRESARLQKLIEDLLNISQINVNALALAVAPLDLNELVTALVTDRRQLASEHGLVLGCETGPALPLAQADPALTVQVLSNIMSNAINYTPHGGIIQVTTALRQAEGRDWVTFSVRDSGPGITAYDLPHIFERFYRGAAARDYTVPGTGVGLAFSQEIIQKMGGRITVESEPGAQQGSTFTVWLPRA